MHRWIWAAVVVAISLAAAGCGSSGGTATHARPSSDQLTGFAASSKAWDAHHREDKTLAPGAAYDPETSLIRSAQDDQRGVDRYYGVEPQDGRVTVYSMRFPPGTDIGRAQRSLLRTEFPSDARIAWAKRRTTCSQMYVQSAAVARATGGGAIVEFSSGRAGDRYDPRDVWSATLIGLGSSAARSLGC